MWIQLFIALLAYLGAKKQGASSSKAALVAAGAGFAANYVVKETEWGQTNLQPINDTISGWFGISGGNVDSSGSVTDSSGNPVATPPGTTPVKQADGSIVFVPNADSSSSSPWSSSISDVLKTWGADGTALVIGTTAAATGQFDKYLPFILLGIGIWALS